MRWLCLAVCLLVSGTADAQQIKHEIDKGSGQWAFTTVWKGADGQRHKAQYTLPAAIIKEDLEEPVYVGLQKLAKVTARDINAHDFGKGAGCKASVDKGQLSIRCTGKSSEKQRLALDTAARIRDDRRATWLHNHGMQDLGGGKLAIDWARHVLDYADDLAPVVAGLGGPTDDPRVFAEKALGFVQTIPYEHRGAKPDKFRRPLSILGRNQGDCDSKTVLYLSLLHQAYPELGLGVVTIRGHAFGALALAPGPGETRVKVAGERWVAVEPVGPARAPIGTVGRHSRRALRFRRYETFRAT